MDLESRVKLFTNWGKDGDLEDAHVHGPVYCLEFTPNGKNCAAY